MAAGREQQVHIRTGLRDGDIGRLIALHGEVYANEAKNFGLRFEAMVARTVAEFVLDNDARGRVWLAESNERLVACCAIVLRGGAQGQLRWVLARPEVRGTGLGRRLVEGALDWCRAQGVQSVYLETTDGLAASRALYESIGFRETMRSTEALWRGEQTLIRMELELEEAPAPSPARGN